MPEEILNLDEVKKIAEKFVREQLKIDVNTQEIEINHIMSDKSEAYCEVDGKVKNRHKSSSGYGSSFGDIFDAFFGSSSHSKKAGTKECFFTLKISAKGRDVISCDFKDIEPSQYAVESQYIVSPSVSELRKSVMDELDSVSKFSRREEETDLLREIEEDIRDRRKRRKRII